MLAVRTCARFGGAASVPYGECSRRLRGLPPSRSPHAPPPHTAAAEPSSDDAADAGSLLTRLDFNGHFAGRA